MQDYYVWYSSNGAGAVFEGSDEADALDLAKAVLVDAGWETEASVETLPFQAREASEEDSLMADLMGQRFTRSDLGNDDWTGDPNNASRQNVQRREVVSA